MCIDIGSLIIANVSYILTIIKVTGEGEVIWGLSVLSAQFFCKFKTSLKNTVYFKKMKD